MLIDFFYTLSFSKCFILFLINAIFKTQKFPGGMLLLRVIIKFLWRVLFSQIVLVKSDK